MNGQNQINSLFRKNECPELPVLTNRISDSIGFFLFPNAIVALLLIKNLMNSTLPEK